MKIAILTLCLHNNYGGILQAYALNRYLRQLGFDASTFNLKIKPKQVSWLRCILVFFWRLIKFAMGKKGILFFNVNKQYRLMNTAGAEQARFIHEHIPTTDISLPILNVNEQLKNFDTFIVGSDQVWRPAFTKSFQKHFFFNFVDSNKTKLSYAASFGVDEFCYDDTQTVQQLLAGFKAVSVREHSGIDICNKLGYLNAECHIDPTMLLTKEQYLELLQLSESIKQTNSIATYILDETELTGHVVQFVSKQGNFRPQAIGKLHRSSYPSIESWIQGIASSSFVVTDSFHGTVFAIIFNKPFISITNKGRGESRFRTLLQRFSLEHRLITKLSDLDKLDLFDIDFSVINAIIDRERARAKDYFTTNID